MNARRGLVTVVAGSIALAWGAAAVGLIQINADLRLSRIYGEAKQVIVGQVGQVDAQRRVLSVKAIETLKGAAAGELVRIQIAEPPELIRDVAAGQPVVILTAQVNDRTVAIIHLADQWLMAEGLPDAKTPAWRVYQKHTLGPSFPGRTVAAAAIMRELKAGKYTLLDNIHPASFATWRDLGALHVKPTAAASADVNGDGKADLLVVSGEGVQLHLGAGSSQPFTDATAAWGLDKVAGRRAAFADVNGDGKPDLLLDRLWINDGARFTAAPALNLADTADLLAVHLADVSGDGLADALALTVDGRLYVFTQPAEGAATKTWPPRPPRALWTGGGDPPLAAHFGAWGDDAALYVMVVRAADVMRYALSDGAAAPADFLRLTGEPAQTRGKPGPLPIRDFAASAVIDLHGGDARPDLFIAVRSPVPRDFALINRGFGAYFVDPDARLLRPAEGRPRRVRAAAMTAANMDGRGAQSLLVIDDTGAVMQVDSPPAPPK